MNQTGMTGVFVASPEAVDSGRAHSLLSLLTPTPGSIVKLEIGKRDNRWTMPRIQKLHAAVRAQGAHLVVVKEGTTINVETGEPA